MKTILTAILLATALPAFAGDPPSSQTNATWEVWGFKLIDGQWIKQDDHCLKTTDLKQATDYYHELLRAPGWYATSNAPGCMPPGVSDSDRAAVDARYIAALVDSANLPFHGPLEYSPDVNDPVNGYNTLHRPGVDNGNPGYWGYYGYYNNGYYGVYRQYYAGPRGGISIRVKVR